ncbi:cAMP-binding domain of CRP or a regulatory subunit of cAMP-dependent protein kinases [Anaerovirgula multivorans]|uniref:cAMP-binding domain of CRP or a regulatory subunit of cAMP-dependent protein kinases n=1 Tax=Anaerovirgula multivorans TaxID=312168 RepID=A0A239JD72_9FIRM|nr:transcriptional regulator YeiL [Anaerovirgula multivorans]SNT02624.1 cAMP-binding domain of CRP or a regulatory subunit of cAMP-dependent protein kinases [Anaerovirgula multivorans]
MMKINDSRKMNQYISKYEIDKIFTEDMRPFMELFLFKRNEHICKETEDIKYIFFFVEGKAKVYTTLSNGKSLLLCFYQGFKVLGDLELMGFQTASTNVQVIDDSYCIGITLQKVETHLLNDAKFLRFICNSLGEKLNRCSKNSSINLLYPLENRLASYILATGKSMDNEGDGRIEFHENLTEIAELLGTSYRHLLRTLKTLALKGAIKRENNHFEIIDKITLTNLAADLYK